jgi:RNA polymerase sigma factor (sigma-70 family)
MVPGRQRLGRFGHTVPDWRTAWFRFHPMVPGATTNKSAGSRVYRRQMDDALGVPGTLAEKAEDGARLRHLFDSHHRRLYGLARRLLPSSDDARDLVQDTYVRAAERLSSVPVGTASEEAWLVRILVNLIRDRWRYSAVRARHRHHINHQDTARVGAEAAFIAKATVWQALELLPPRRRAVLVMCELEGGSIASVARALGVSAVTVRWHLSVGRRELARFIEGKQDEP